MIEKENWIKKHKNASEKDWNDFKKYCINCGFKLKKLSNGSEAICGSEKDDHVDLT